MTQTIKAATIEAALNAAVRTIQDALGVDDGGTAGKGAPALLFACETLDEAIDAIAADKNEGEEALRRFDPDYRPGAAPKSEWYRIGRQILEPWPTVNGALIEPQMTEAARAQIAASSLYGMSFTLIEPRHLSPGAGLKPPCTRCHGVGDTQGWDRDPCDHCQGTGAEPAPTPAPDAQIRSAMELLREAGRLLREAGAMRAHRRVAAAIKSADGAKRHAEGKAYRMGR